MVLNSLVQSVRQAANYAPLFAALLAPASTLYDIPALSQKWYSLNGVELSDPHASLILSGFSLAASILANTFLVLRFSVRVSKQWRLATRLSAACWLIKTAIGMANLITFGALTRNGTGYEYLEGFWCAILSVVLSGLITILLFSHYFLHFSDAPDQQVRFEGRTLITSELILFGLIALNALVFSKIEGWKYLDGIYFSVVTLLSIGFGDFSPTHTSTKILLFPYVVSGIALLANQISIIIEASSHRAHRRKQRMRDRCATQISAYEERHERYAGIHNQLSDSEALYTEIKRLRKQAQREADSNELAELVYSACALVVFWLLGALIYHFMEGWTYGDSLYFNYVFFLTIGFGDFSPETAVGRVVFVIWSLLAVPIMTNFVVTTVQSLVTHASRILAMATTQKKIEVRELEEEFYEPHSTYLAEAIRRLQGDGSDTSSGSRSRSSSSITNSKEVRRRKSNDESSTDVEAQVDGSSDSSTMMSVRKDLLFELLSTSCFLEAQARRLMIQHMDRKAHTRLLLEADSNIQLYTLDRMGKREQTAEFEEWEKSMGDAEALERVKQYRKTYAKVLVMGSQLMKLEGDDLIAFQRKRTRETEEDKGETLNGDGDSGE